MPRVKWLSWTRDSWSGFTFSLTFGRTRLRTLSVQWGGR